MAEGAQKSQKDEVTSSLSNLSLDTSKGSAKPARKKSKKAVADSWEDEDLSSSGDEQEEQGDNEHTAPLPMTSSSKPSMPGAPPPTPISPATSQQQWRPDGSSAQQPPERRPEKTDAVARRMIAAGLGLKAPKQTEEQKEYQRSIREQEKKRREQEKVDEQKRKEEAERAKAAIWDD